MVTTSFDSCRTDCLLVTSNLRSATVAFTTELDTLIPYLLLVHDMIKLLSAVMYIEYSGALRTGSSSERGSTGLIIFIDLLLW